MHGEAHHKKEILDEILKVSGVNCILWTKVSLMLNTFRRCCALVSPFFKDTRGEDGGYCCAIELSKDSIANYVASKALENSDKDVQEKIFELISSAREELVRVLTQSTRQC